MSTFAEEGGIGIINSLLNILDEICVTSWKYQTKYFGFQMSLTYVSEKEKKSKSFACCFVCFVVCLFVIKFCGIYITGFVSGWINSYSDKISRQIGAFSSVFFCKPTPKFLIDLVNINRRMA